MKLDDVKKLHQKKYRNQYGYYLVEGEHLILELHKARLSSANTAEGAHLDDTQPIQLYVTEDYQQWANDLDGQYKILTVSKKQMEKLSDTKSPQGIVALVPLPKAKVESDPSTALRRAALRTCSGRTEGKGNQGERSIYLHEVQDPGNLGTILRTLAWFGNFRLLLSPNSVDPFNPKVVRSSMGAIFHVALELDVELDTLQNRFDRFAYLDMDGTKVNDSSFTDYECYLFGNEARGVPRDQLSNFNAQAFTIPGSGSIESLNLASAVNMCAYQLSI
jgi:TrmH family RNA methyltransferase